MHPTWFSILLLERAGLGSSESLIEKSRSKRLLSIRHENQAHPAARNTPLKHRVLGPAIRSSGMPAQTDLLANVLSSEKPGIHLFQVAFRNGFRNLSSLTMNFSFWIHYKD